MFSETKLLVLQQKVRELLDFKTKIYEPIFLQEVKSQQETKHEFVNQSLSLISFHSKSVLKAFQSHNSHLECFQLEHKNDMNPLRLQMLSTEFCLTNKEV